MRRQPPAPRPRRRRMPAVGPRSSRCARRSLPAAVAAAAVLASPAAEPVAGRPPSPACLSPADRRLRRRRHRLGRGHAGAAGQDVAVSLAGVRVAHGAVTDASAAYSVAGHARARRRRGRASGRRRHAQRGRSISSSSPRSPSRTARPSRSSIVQLRRQGRAGRLRRHHHGRRSCTTARASPRSRRPCAAAGPCFAGAAARRRQVRRHAVAAGRRRASAHAPSSRRCAPRGRASRPARPGARVRGLLTALSRLQIRVPYIGTTFNTQCADAVMAFQKAYRLPRTYVVRRRRLAQARRRQDRSSRATPGPSTHIEVDKGRQILMVVKNGAVYGLIAVSTGATGNTPEGSFRIQQKHPYTTSGYGGILFRTMGFIGNFAIHGYVAGAAVPGQPRLHPRADVGGRLDVQPVLGGRAAVRLPLSPRAGSDRHVAQDSTAGKRLATMSRSGRPGSGVARKSWPRYSRRLCSSIAGIWATSRPSRQSMATPSAQSTS